MTDLTLPGMPGKSAPIRACLGLISAILLANLSPLAAQTKAPEMPKSLLGSVAFWSMPDSYRFEMGAFSKDGSTFGSFYENAPLIPYQWKRGQYKHGHFFPTFQDAQASGINAFDLDCFEDTSFENILWWLEEARLSETGVKISLMLDRMPTRGTQFLANLWQQKEIINHPNLFKVGDKPFITSFGYREPGFWKEVLKANAAAGANYIIIGDISGLGADVWERGILPLKAKESLSLLSGGWYFAGDPSRFTTGNSIIDSLKAWAQEQSPEKLFGASVRWGYISSRRVGHLISPDGTTRFRQTWLEIIKDDPNFVYLTTLNDYSETEMECSANATFTFLDLNRYFSHRWKTGQWPALTQVTAFVTYRKAVAVDEPALFEVVLLRPDLTGEESSQTVNQTFTAKCTITLSDGSTVQLPEVKAEVLPGHLCWRFQADGFPVDGFGTPQVTLFEDGKALPLPQGRLASFAIVGAGDDVARKWLNVPLHRIYPRANVRLKVTGSPENLYPRTITLEGLPDTDVVGGVIERNANSLHPILLPDELTAGYVEEFYDGPGYGPVYYEDGFSKRTMMDQVDRYTAVVRMSDNRFLYPEPVQMPAPHVDAATVQDYILSTSRDELIDRGPLRRNFTLPQDKSKRPEILQDPASKVWFLRFNGTSDYLKFGESYSPHAKNAMTMPPGPASLELWIRPEKIGANQVVFASERPVLDIELGPDLSVRLTRTNEYHHPVFLEGQTPLSRDEWHHLVAVFTGSHIRLFIDGVEAAEPVPCQGLRTESGSVLGASVNSVPKDFFGGDIARFRVLQRALSENEISESYQAQHGQF